MTRPRYARDRIPPTTLALASLQPTYDSNFQPNLQLAPGSVQLMTAAPIGVFGMGAATDGTPDTSQNPYPAGQCTWGVWLYVYTHFGVAMPRLAGNATDWVDEAKRKNWKVTMDVTENTIVCWSDAALPPYGHVAFVTKVDRGTTSVVGGILGTEQSKQPTFTVDEYNFKVKLGHGTRTITAKLDNPEFKGIRGFIQVPGVTPGANAGTQVNSEPTNPWDELNTGIQQVSKQMQQQVNTLANKTFAGAQIGAGMAVLAGAGVFTIMALKSPAGAQAAVRGAAGMPRQLAGRANRTVVPVAQDAVLGPKPPDLSPTGRVPRARAARTLPR